jgi:hypothetical protein
VIYPYKCPHCGATEDVWQKLAEYTSSPRIPVHCDTKMDRVFTVPMVAPDYQPFVSHVDGSVINSRSEHREHMLKHNLVMLDEVMPDIPRNRKATTEAGFATLKDDIFEAAQQVEQGYKPTRAEAKVEGDTPEEWIENGIDMVSSLPPEELVQVAGV